MKALRIWRAAAVFMTVLALLSAGSVIYCYAEIERLGKETDDLAEQIDELVLYKETLLEQIGEQ